MTQSVGASSSVGRWRYAVPGFLSWSIIVMTVTGLVLFPRTWLYVATAFLIYFLLRMFVHLVFAVVGDFKRRDWERIPWRADDEEVGPAGFAPADVWHIVVVPAYREPAEVLRRTLDGLARQHRARERVVAVLGMEERDESAPATAMLLAQEYAALFARMIVTYHPANIPGEVPGKSSNENWAAREAKRIVCDEMGIERERITITSCDADSVLHPEYLAAVSKLFVSDDRRYARFWQAPLLYYNNIWQVPAPIRFTTWFVHAGQIAELAMPFYTPLPISTYTLSLTMAEECGWWDPAVIPEDWHMFLQCFMARDGDVGLTSVFLPTMADATDGDTWWGALRNRFVQVMRHSWGAEDVGYLLGKLMERRRRPSARMLFRFGQVLHDHVFRVVTWFLVTSAYILNLKHWPVYAYAGPIGYVPVRAAGILGPLFTLGGVAILLTLLVELRRNPPPAHMSPIRVAIEIGAMWMSLPVIGFGLGMLPALNAQTKLMLGLPLSYKATPKRVAKALDAA